MNNEQMLKGNIRKSCYWIARSYYDFKKNFTAGRSDVISEEEAYRYIRLKEYISAIESSFKMSVEKTLQKNAWDYFYQNNHFSEDERQLLEAEIEKWLYFLAKELSLIIH